MYISGIVPYHFARPSKFQLFFPTQNSAICCSVRHKSQCPGKYRNSPVSAVSISVGPSIVRFPNLTK